MKKYLLGLGFALIPFVAAAQFGTAPVQDANDVLLKFADIMDSAVWVLISLAVLFIIWNAVMFIKHAGGDDRGKYQNAILWGIVGLFLILSIWGLVNILGRTFKTGNLDNADEASEQLDGLMIGSDKLREQRAGRGGSSSGGGGVFNSNSNSNANGGAAVTAPHTDNSGVITPSGSVLDNNNNTED